MKKLNLNAIRIDGGTQSRVEINNDAVSDYAEAVKVGIEFPPVVVFHDGADHWLADGFHRYHAHKQAGKASIPAEIRSGSLLDAKLHALGANGTHGLRRSNADKRKAVEMAMAEPAWKDWSDRKIADACGVSNTFVSNLRKPPVVSTVDTRKAAPDAGKAAAAAPKSDNGYHPEAEKGPSKAPAKKAARTLDNRPADVPEDTGTDALAEAQHAIADLAAENERLNDRLAVEAMDASEDEKTRAAETIRELRARVVTLEAEVDALKVSRDTYMREASEAKKQVTYWRKQAEKAAKEAA
jgi:ParB-like chromosome segregation protein Spo0J